MRTCINVFISCIFLVIKKYRFCLSKKLRAFQAAFTQTPTQWSAVDQTQARKGRADILAAVAAALVATPAAVQVSLGMVVLEVVAPDADNHPGLAAAVKPLLQQLSELVVTMGVEMQALFPKEWP